MDRNKKMNISDEDLVTKCIEGEKWARDIFYERFFKLVIFKVNKIKEKYTYNFTKDDIEDCIQEIWKSFWGCSLTLSGLLLCLLACFDIFFEPLCS